VGGGPGLYSGAVRKKALCAAKGIGLSLKKARG